MYMTAYKVEGEFIINSQMSTDLRDWLQNLQTNFRKKKFACLLAKYIL